MKLAAARGIASVVADDELAEDYIMPSVFNRDVSRAVAEAVAEEAERDGASRAAGATRWSNPPSSGPRSADRYEEVVA